MIVGNLNRGLAILELLARDAPGLPMHEIAGRLQIPRSATHRLLTELVQYGYVRQEQDYGRYLLTMKLCTLGLTQLSRCGIVEIVQPFLDHLAEISGEMARLGLVDEDQLVWVAKAQGSSSALRFDPDMGGVAQLASTASGHAFLSTLSEETAIELVNKQGGFVLTDDHGQHVPKTIVELLNHLNLTRERGYSILSEAVHAGIAAIAVPVKHIGTGRTLGTLSIAGPSIRLTDEKMIALGPAMLETVENLSASAAASPMLNKATASLKD